MTTMILMTTVLGKVVTMMIMMMIEPPDSVK